eukprot:TRINITY_DN27374_c0_g2_i7.p2 TRINITY_DN27374_c0_g2~~TRINITY_DN27374_c0_g2_i7.p2  ORF type:complete len:147 (-),score=7.62 TRINITY_DN27374_c0_g2_i7:85-525(-)
MELGVFESMRTSLSRTETHVALWMEVGKFSGCCTCRRSALLPTRTSVATCTGVEEPCSSTRNYDCGRLSMLLPSGGKSQAHQLTQVNAVICAYGHLHDGDSLLLCQWPTDAQFQWCQDVLFYDLQCCGFPMAMLVVQCLAIPLRLS